MRDIVAYIIVVGAVIGVAFDGDVSYLIYTHTLTHRLTALSVQHNFDIK